MYKQVFVIAGFRWTRTHLITGEVVVEPLDGSETDTFKTLPLNKCVSGAKVNLGG